MFPHAGARGLQYPPLLNIWRLSVEHTSLREGSGTLTWGHSKWDPTDTIPIVSTGAARAGQSLTSLPLDRQVELDGDPAIYARHMWGRSYDDPTFYRVATRWRDAVAVNGA
jgi:hypothetical protein